MLNFMQHVAKTRPSSQTQVELQKVLSTFSLIPAGLSNVYELPGPWVSVSFKTVSSQSANNDVVDPIYYNFT